jgi:hypothetical protein
MTYGVKAMVLAAGVVGWAMAVPAAAQIRTVDPNAAMSSDLAPVPSSEASYGTKMSPQPQSAPQASATDTAAGTDVQSRAPAAPAAAASQDPNNAYQENDIMTAAEGVFGKGAEGLAKLIEKILKEQGRPNAYIAGREVSGAVVVGLRYGSGTLFHKVEGQRPVYWTGPSIGFDLGGNGAKTFMLVYNLYDSQDIYRRFPGGEGVVYVIGGFTASYQRIGDIVLIPIRLGVGWRLGANVGYMKFTPKSTFMPF